MDSGLSKKLIYKKFRWHNSATHGPNRVKSATAEQRIRADDAEAKFNKLKHLSLTKLNEAGQENFKLKKERGNASFV